jgi:predicted DNA-binding transcriptional regulator
MDIITLHHGQLADSEESGFSEVTAEEAFGVNGDDNQNPADDITGSAVTAKWFIRCFHHQTYNTKAGTKADVFVRIPLHVYGFLMFMMAARGRVLLYLLYRASLNGERPFPKPDCKELARNLGCSSNTVYQAMAFWLKTGIFKPVRKGRTDYIALATNWDDLILGIEKNSLGFDKEILRRVKVILRIVKEQQAVTQGKGNSHKGFQEVGENSKDILLDIIIDNDKDASPSSSNNAQNKKLSTPSINEICSTLKTRHLKKFPDYEFTTADPRGFMKAAKLLAGQPADNFASYTKLGRTIEAVAADYVEYIADMAEESKWTTAPHGGNYANEENIREFVKYTAHTPYRDAKARRNGRSDGPRTYPGMRISKAKEE